MDCFTSTSKSKKLSLLCFNTAFLFLLSFYFATLLLDRPGKTTASASYFTQFRRSPLQSSNGGCSGLHDYPDYESKCAYLKSHTTCSPKGYIDYLEIFYCSCGRKPELGYFLLILWLVLLFYLLGNTAADYFCPSLESLSRVLKLSPTIAGTTLLPLGNGATDVFSSIVSFTRSGEGDVGLNCVLGGAFFISSVVVGVIGIFMNSRDDVAIDKSNFIRDVLFFLFALSSLLVIIVVGRINFWFAVCFTSIYFIYIFVVSAMQLFYSKTERVVNPPAVLPNTRGLLVHFRDEFDEVGIPLLGYVDEEKCISSEKDRYAGFDQTQRTWCLNLDNPTAHYLEMFLCVINLPLHLPRRLTIPVVSEERWSKPFAVISAVLAPILLATLWNTQGEKYGSKTSLVIYMTAGLVGMILGNVAYLATEKSHPPNKCLFLWLAGGFLMSIIWTYIIAEELVSLLVSFGTILGIDPSILGLTVLAWGNSTGDLMANTAIALTGGPDGAQIAMSGCFAGPMFNTLVGLGFSLVLASWSLYPSSYVIPSDPSLYETIGFLMGGLLWALVILPKKNMRPDRFLGIGLLAIYLCFLFLRLARALGY